VSAARTPARKGRGLFLLGCLGSSAISAIGAIALVVLLVVAVQKLVLPAPGGHGSGPNPNPSPSSLDPGTYAAGTLKAPANLKGVALSPPSTQKEVQNLKKSRDDFSQLAGGAPAIAADYGSLLDLLQLAAAQGYADPDQYFGSSQVKYQMVGPIKCGSQGITICIRSDKTQSLSVVVSGFSDVPTTAGAVAEAWKDFGGT
jgi:hypothetical protein